MSEAGWNETFKPAQTIAEPGIELGAIQTTSTIESALRNSINRSGA